VFKNVLRHRWERVCIDDSFLTKSSRPPTAQTIIVQERESIATPSRDTMPNTSQSNSSIYIEFQIFQKLNRQQEGEPVIQHRTEQVMTDRMGNQSYGRTEQVMTERVERRSIATAESVRSDKLSLGKFRYSCRL